MACNAPNYGRGLCARCHKQSRLSGTLHEYSREPSLQEKIREEWPHFTSLLGTEGAVFRLAKAFEVDEEVARKAACIHPERNAA